MSDLFATFSKAVHARFVEMSKRELFTVQVEDLFDKYLAAYSAKDNPMFRQRTVYDCQCCKQFVKRLGRVVNIVDNKMVTVWDDLDVPEPFKSVAVILAREVRTAKVIGVFRSKETKYGSEYNYDPKTNDKYEHFHGKVASKHHANEPGSILADKTSTYQVLKRGLEELKISDFDEVLDLINADGLYKGAEFRPAIEDFRSLLIRYNEAGRNDLFVWEHLEEKNARFRNTAIGQLFVSLAEGKEFDSAVASYEAIVAPTSYKRPTAPITKKMLEGAVQELADLGLIGAIQRRYARLSDVSVNDVLFVDNETQSQMKDGITKLLEADVKKVMPNLKAANPISADVFVKMILPTATTLDVLVQNRHQGNFLSLTCGDGPERLFKWNNNFAWSYDGDTTDSVKQRVKKAGGNVDAKLRVSLSWFNFDDLDLHAQTPSGTHVYYREKHGILDVDMNAGHGTTRSAVENLAFNHLSDGVYKIWVNQFARRESVDVGFEIEVEYAGVVHQYSYDRCAAGDINCFNLTVKGGELVKIEPGPLLKGGVTSQEKWGVHTETLTSVAAVLNSPNHWDGQSVGARHLIFALKGCKNPGETRGMYNEFLRPEFEKHRKVLEILGARSKCKFADEQVSGVGFTAARGDSVTVVVNGKRAYTIGF